MGAVTTVIRPFKLDSANCYYCSSELKPEEAEHKAAIRYYDKDGNERGKIVTYVCFDCVERFTGMRPTGIKPDHEINKVQLTVNGT